MWKYTLNAYKAYNNVFAIMTTCHFRKCVCMLNDSIPHVYGSHWVRRSQLPGLQLLVALHIYNSLNSGLQYLQTPLCVMCNTIHRRGSHNNSFLNNVF